MSRCTTANQHSNKSACALYVSWRTILRNSVRTCAACCVYHVYHGVNCANSCTLTVHQHYTTREVKAQAVLRRLRLLCDINQQ
eukprot:20404-Heterococcus_DN1.PRE.1